MAYENVVGLHVTNDELYTKYREAMIPILKNYGGGFRYDFRISENLKSETGNQINRLFVIYFEDKEKMESFFSNEEYLKIRQKYFTPSVETITTISQYIRDKSD